MGAVAAHVLKNKLRGRTRYPLVLMLEPLFRCNLACAGCGKIQYPAHVLRRQLSPEDCFRAAEECGAPIVSIPGGEPLLHPQIGEIVEGLVARRKYVYLCTNALLLAERLDRFRPSKRLILSVHLDGLEPEHDASVCRPGAYAIAVGAMREALARGFRVMTNTTLYSTADPERVRAFLEEMSRLGVEGMMLSPGYSYSKAPDREHFLRVAKTRELFRAVLSPPRGRWKLNQSPLFLEFLAGSREYSCTPWGMPTYSIFGWQRPCYLLQDGYARTYRELLERTDWSRYGRGRDERCSDCMVHSGYEASAVDETFGSLRGLLAAARAALFGPRLRPSARRPEEARGGETESKRSKLEPRRVSEAWFGARQAWVRDEQDPSLLGAVVEAAFDYRGDVTLRLENGAELVGYVCHRDASGAEPFLEVLPADGSPSRRVLYREIRSVAFTGKDAASVSG